MVSSVFASLVIVVVVVVIALGGFQPCSTAVAAVAATTASSTHHAQAGVHRQQQHHRRVETSEGIPLASNDSSCLDVAHQGDDDRSISDDSSTNNINTIQEATYNFFEMILSQDLQGMDPLLPQCVMALKSRGAHRCWHKHSTFLEHLLGVHHILRLWEQGPTIARVGLFHSAYSNSYVNLALFQPDRERPVMQALVGEPAEELVHLFCIINRQEVVVNTLLKQGYIPREGMYTPHLRNTNEQVFLSAETLRMLVVFTMADIADQYFGWQDRLFGGDDHSMLLPGKDQVESHEPTALWPGLSKPGLWLHYVSQLGAVARTIVNDTATTTAAACSAANDDPSAAAQLVPPVFDNCTKILSREDEIMSRDLYWSVMTGQVDNDDDDKVLQTLHQCIKLNPWVFEPHVVLAQKLLHRGDFVNGQRAAERALELQQQWGTAWDKRLSFSAWVAWTRVLHQRAVDQLAWPINSWDVNNFGLVRG